MIPATTISGADWMHDARVQVVMRALGEGQALFVGGCVRDALMGRHGGDIDIATVLSPEDVQEKLCGAGIKNIPTGVDHGTITVIVEGASFEITTLRKDVATDGRRAVVAFTKDWYEDAARRDFTVNALYADGQGNIFDPLEQGVDDLKTRTLRFVGDAAQRIAEDHLRILRYFRFAAQFGWALDDGQALAACRKAAEKIKTLSRERVTHEMLKLLDADNPAGILEQMRVHDILPEMLKTYEQDAMERMISRHPLTRLVLLSRAEQRLALSNAQKHHVQTVRDGAAAFRDETAGAIKRLVYSAGNGMAFEVYALWCALNKKEPQAALLDILHDWQAPIFPVTGDDLIKKGYQPGPILGQKLKELEAAWIEENF